MVLITGASGFLGQHLTRYLSAQGETIRALYYRHPPTEELKKLPGVEWMKCDLLDIFELEEAMSGITHVYHCAAWVSFNPGQRTKMLHFNIEGTANLVNQAVEQGITKLVHVSSIAALGRKAESKNEITEDDPWEESKYNSVYAKSKYYSELEIWRGIAEGLDAVIINPGIILGEGDWNEGSANIMRVVYKQFPYYTNGVNGWVDVKDVVKAMHLLMQNKVTAERFILSAGNYKYHHIFNTMAKALNKKPPHIYTGPLVTGIVARLYLLKNRIFGGPATITPETSRNAHLSCYYNNEKLIRFIPGFTYQPLENTIKRMSEAYLAGISGK